MLEFKSQVGFRKLPLSPKIKPDLNTALRFNLKHVVTPNVSANFKLWLLALNL